MHKTLLTLIDKLKLIQKDTVSSNSVCNCKKYSRAAESARADDTFKTRLSARIAASWSLVAPLIEHCAAMTAVKSMSIAFLRDSGHTALWLR